MVPTTEGSEVRETIYLQEENLFIRYFMIFFFIFFAAAAAAAAAFSPRHYFFFFYCGHEHDITSTELLWSTHCFHCIMMINGDPNTASCFSLFCYWGDFFSSFHAHKFISKPAPYAPMCVVPIHLKCTIPSVFLNHTNYCGANPDCCCHGNYLLGVMAPLKLKWMKKSEEVGDRLPRRHTHTHTRQLIMCQHISCFILFCGVYYWQFTLTRNDLTAELCSTSMPENESDAGEWG